MDGACQQDEPWARATQTAVRARGLNGIGGDVV
jgi:hypothetical protein